MNIYKTGAEVIKHLLQQYLLNLCQCKYIWLIRHTFQLEKKFNDTNKLNDTALF